MTEAEQLASELQAAIDGINEELAQISEERWSSTITAAEGWSVGHTAHHIGEGYQQSLSWIEQAGRTGQPVVLDPAVDIPRINVANARCLNEHGAESRAETLTLLRDAGRRLVDRVRSLTDEQVEAPMMIVRGEPRPGRLVALPMALRHANVHLESIRTVLAPA